MIKIDHDMLELWQDVCEKYDCNISAFVGFIVGTVYQCMDMNYIRITTNLELPHLHSFHNGKHVTLQASICSGSDFYNYKHYFSVTLLVIINQRHISDRGDL